jgi:hypothetical protein
LKRIFNVFLIANSGLIYIFHFSIISLFPNHFYWTRLLLLHVKNLCLNYLTAFTLLLWLCNLCHLREGHLFSMRFRRNALLLRSTRFEFLDKQSHSFHPYPLKCRFLTIWIVGFRDQANALKDVGYIIESSNLSFELLLFDIFLRNLSSSFFQGNYFFPADKQTYELLA